MKRPIAIVAAGVLALALTSVTVAKRKEARTQASPITQTIEDFWISLGRLDAEAMKQTFDWPVSIVEASEQNTKNPRVLMSPADLDREVSDHRPASGHTEFFGTELSGFKVEMLNQTLALVKYTARLPKDISSIGGRDFNAVAILRKTNDPKPWKILFITVPK